MAKVIRLLEQMGLVHGQPGETHAEPAPETEDAGLSDPAVLLAPPGLAHEPPEPQAVRLDPALQAAAAKAAAAGDAGGDYPIEQIYASAGLTNPEHGFTVDTLAEMMEAEELKGLDSSTRAKVITGMLRRLPSGPVALDDIVADAARRDQALDAFERFLADRVAKAEAEVTETNRALQEEIDQLVRRNSELMQANQARVESERAKLGRWLERKRAEEERLFNAVQPFVEANPVTRSPGDTDPTPGGE